MAVPLEEKQPAPTPRPLLGLSAAVAGGTALGLWAEPPRGALELALAAAVLALVAALRCGGPRGRRLALVAVLAAAAAVRGAGARPEPAEPPAVGRWRPAGALEGIGHLGPAGQRFELPPGAVAAGERALLAPGAAAPRFARAPLELVGAPAGFAPDRGVRDDELARLAPAPGGPGPALRGALGALREGGLARLARLRDPAARGLAAALLFGDRSLLPPELPDLFTRTGTRHALAISGLHVGLLAWILVRPLGWVLARLARRARGRGRGAPGPEAWRALLLALLVPLAGSGAPVLRAALALSLFELAGGLPRGPGGARRRGDALSLWAAAATVEALVRPATLASLSFQLSYAATLGLLLATGGARRALQRLLPHPAVTTRGGRRLPAGLRVPVRKLGELTLASLALSVAANLATLPLVWARFGEWSPAGIAATPLLAPLLAGFLGAGWLWLALPVAPLAAVLELLAEAMLGLLALFDALPLTPTPLPPRPLALLALAAAAGIALLRGVRSPTRRHRLARAAAALTAALLLPWTLGPRRLELVALDVGHGTACVLRAPGAPCWIFDAGTRDRPGLARRALEPLLRRLDVGRLAVCLSHADRDHDGALDRIAARWPPEVWVGALSARSDERLPHATRRLDVGVGRLRLENGSLALTLARGAAGEDNEGSRSLVVELGGERLLLCGDAEGPGLAAQLRLGLLEGPFELVLQPHHGSDTPELGPFLDRTRPREVWVSAPERPAVAEELERRGLPWRSTGEDGPLRYPGAGSPARFVRLAGPRPTDPVPAAPGAALPRKETSMSTTPMDLSRTLTRPALVALTALALAAAAPARQAPADDETPAAAQDERAAVRGRVLTLTSGELVRGRTRWVADADSPNGGRWELFENRAWRPLREGSVASWRDERDLLREADRLAREVRAGEHERRVELARWMVAHGLAEEAIVQLDRVLRDEPDHDGALNLIARGGFPSPQEVDERRDAEAARELLIQEGRTSSPTRRELAIRALGALEDQDGVRAALLRELTVFRHQQRFFATHALRRLLPGEELLSLLSRSVLDRSGEVRLGASLALRASGEEAVIVPLARALESEHRKVRMNAAESLGNVGFAAAVPALMTHMATLAQSSSSYRPPAANIMITNQVAYVGDFDVEIAQGASIADPQVNVVTEGVVLDGRAYGFQEYSVVDEFVTVRSSLKQLTGHDAGRNPEKWLAWYEEHRERYEGGGESE